MQLALYGSIAWKHPFGFSRVLEWAREYGWDMVDARGMTVDIPGDAERRLLALGYDMLGPRQIRPSARDDVKRRVAEYGLSLLCISCPAPVNLDGTVGCDCRELFREFLELAADLEIPWVRSINNTTTCDTGEQMSDAEAFERTVEGLRDVGGQAAELGVGILLENNENTTASSPEDLLRMQSAVGDVCRVGIAYDPVNAYFKGHDPAAGLETLAGRIDVLHLKNVRRHEGGEFSNLPHDTCSYEWTSLAEGDLDWRALLEQAVGHGFDGPLTFVHLNPSRGMPPAYWEMLREPEEAAREESAYLRAVLDGLARE
ncbi:MAG: sugar phosphate isomerase/epimerase family protein [Maioricimonas sp. JB049]